MKTELNQANGTIRVRLRTKFIISIIILQCLLMAAITIVVESRMRESILSEFLKRGLSVAENLATANTNYLAIYNYVNIEQSVQKVAESNDLVYATILLFDGEVAAYRGRKNLQQRILNEKIQGRTLHLGNTLVRYGNLGNLNEEICDISVPIVMKGEKWGTARVGFALNDMRAAILKTQVVLFGLGFMALIGGCLCIIFLTRRMTRPIDDLVKGVEAISTGNFDQGIHISTHDEIGYLGHRFTSMQQSLRDHIQLITKTNVELTQANQRLQSLFQVSQAIHSLQNQEKIYSLILESALTATGAFAGSLTLIDENQRPRTVALANRSQSGKGVNEPSQENVIEDPSLLRYQSFLSGPGMRSVVLHLGGLKERMPFYSVHLDSDPERELLSIPLHQGEMLVGFVNLVRTKNADRVSDSEIQTLSVLSSQASASLENKKLFLQLESAYLSSIKSLAKTLEFKDEYTHGHAERVAKLCMEIGKCMNMDEKSLKVLHNAALLHDIGKIGVMEGILNKRSELEFEEWGKIKWHPAFGEEILRPISSLKEEAVIIRHHHEREDGTGYPEGLYGNQLSLSEKIIIVADAYDAMNSKRAYRNSLNPSQIRQELEKNRGTQFNTEVIDVFLRILNGEGSTTSKDKEVTKVGKVIPFSPPAV